MSVTCILLSNLLLKLPLRWASGGKRMGWTPFQPNPCGQARSGLTHKTKKKKKRRKKHVKLDPILKIHDFSLDIQEKIQKTFPLFQKTQKYIFFQEFHFKIGLQTYTVTYGLGIKNTWFSLKFQKKIQKNQKIFSFQKHKKYVLFSCIQPNSKGYSCIFS